MRAGTALLLEFLGEARAARAAEVVGACYSKEAAAAAAFAAAAFIPSGYSLTLPMTPLGAAGKIHWRADPQKPPNNRKP